MLIKSILLTIAWFALAVVISGCCNCPSAPTHNFRWTTLTTSTHGYTILDREVSYPDDTCVDFSDSALVIRAELGYELLAAQQAKPFSLFNQAYACSCVDGFYKFERSLSSLKVLTLQPFDTQHPAMSDVTEYFKSKRFTNNGYPDGLGDLNLRLENSSIYEMPDSKFDLYLDRKPVPGADYQFRIVLTLNDGSTIESTTSKLQF